MRAFMLVVVLALAPGFALAETQAGTREAPVHAEDPVIEQRLRGIADELRCLVCQNESLAASHAELAEDLRREIRTQMKAGLDDAQVIQYLTDRYGDFVLYRPPLKPVTYLLWFGPLLFLAIGAATWYVILRRRKTLQEAPADPAKLAAAAALLDESQTK